MVATKALYTATASFVHSFATAFLLFAPTNSLNRLPLRLLRHTGGEGFAIIAPFEKSFQSITKRSNSCDHLTRRNTSNSNSRYNRKTLFQSMSTSKSQFSSSVVASNLDYVQQCISSCIQGCNRSEGGVRLVAVSKTKPVELLMEAYEVRTLVHKTLFFHCKNVFN